MGAIQSKKLVCSARSYFRKTAHEYGFVTTSWKNCSPRIYSQIVYQLCSTTLIINGCWNCSVKQKKHFQLLSNGTQADHHDQTHLAGLSWQLQPPNELSLPHCRHWKYGWFQPQPNGRESNFCWQTHLQRGHYLLNQADSRRKWEWEPLVSPTYKDIEVENNMWMSDKPHNTLARGRC